ncbi:MAG: phospholipase D-like domain-containing protein [Marmoricola sp.]
MTPTTAARTVESAGTIAANPDYVTQRSYYTASWPVLTNDKCENVTPCTVANLSGFPVITTKPAGWTVTVTTAATIRVTIPENTVTGPQVIGYSITDSSATVNGTLTVQVVLPPTPNHYNPPQGSKFSHAFISNSAYNIRTHVLRTIGSVPAGSQIRILSWSFNSPKIMSALIAAKRRGVSVQIIMSPPADPRQSEYRSLVKYFGLNRYGKNSLRGSWVYKCRASCRGTGGTMHAKVFLFSQAYNTRWVIMSGSGNLTDFASKGQWNQQYTTTNNEAAYNAILNVFMQAKADRAVRPRQLTLTFPTTTYFFTPLSTRTTTSDFIYQALNKVQCTGAANSTGRTRVRISMYTWRDTRGDWMARQVRRLWNAGCDVRIIFAIMGTRNKAILYSPSGRGRIPMRQTILVDSDHRPVWYLHQKYIAVGGKISGDPSAFQTFQGSFNFSDLGMRSDENMQQLNGYAAYAPYITDFDQIWKQRQTRAPDPNSYVKQAERTVRLGTGRYKFMDPD